MKLAEDIGTFSEGLRDPIMLSEIRAMIGSAETVVFLGFAFHKQNLELMTPVTGVKVKRYFATTMGISGADWKVIDKEVSSLLINRYNLPVVRPNGYSLGGTCYETIKHFWRSLGSAPTEA